MPEDPALLENPFKTLKEDEQLIAANFVEQEGTKIYPKRE
jgi:hypothetical protein